MEIRKTKVEDIPAIMELVHHAQTYFQSQGIPQWNTGYPNENTFKQDIEVGGSYVLCDNDKIIGTCFLKPDDEPTYKIIEQGNWLNDEPYTTIHRITVDTNYKGQGLAGKIFAFIEEATKAQGKKNIRVDTHEVNKSMRKTLEKNGYIYCGIVYMSDGAPRVAYQKVLK